MEDVFKTWRILDVVSWTANYFREKGIGNNQLEAEWLVGHFLNLSRLELYLQFDRPLKETELSKIREGIRERIKSKPLQLITGVTEFMDITLRVREGVLIPRPETEVLVENILEEIKKFKKPEILDVGCGSGNISCSLAIQNDEAVIWAIDSNPEAISLAQENVARLGLSDRINISLRDWNSLNSSQQYDAIVSNPPYVRESEYEELPDEIKNYEPKSALVAGADGLDFIKDLISRSYDIIKKGGIFAFEIGINQDRECVQLMEKRGYKNIRIIDDYSHKPRVIIGEKIA